MERLWFQGRIFIRPDVVRQLVPGHRSGTDHFDDRELPYRLVMEPVYRLPRGEGRHAGAGLYRPIPVIINIEKYENCHKRISTIRPMAIVKPLQRRNCHRRLGAEDSWLAPRMAG